MRSAALKSLILLTFVAGFLVCSFGSNWYDEWIPILSEDFESVDIIGDMIVADIGHFLINDPNDVLRYESDDGKDGYIVFEDHHGAHTEPSVLESYPVEDFTKISLLLEFDLRALQTDSSFSAALNDDDGIPIFTCSMGSSGTWLVNRLDTQVAYEVDTNYTVTVYVEIDMLGGPTLYSVGVTKILGQNQTSYDPLSSGWLYDFTYGDVISSVDFAKPPASGVGTFILDEVFLGYQDVSSRNWLNNKMRKNP